MMRLLTTLLLAAVCTACGGPSRDGNAFTFDEAGMAYRVEFRTENTVRILVRPAGSPLVTQRLVVDSVPAAPVEVRREAIEHGYAFRTPQLRVEFDRTRGLFSFRDARTDALLLAETARSLRPDTVGGEACYAVTQRFAGTDDEALYGLGQYQTGALNYKRDTVLLLQANKDIVNPYLVSTRGFGLLWDNYSASEFPQDACAATVR